MSLPPSLLPRKGAATEEFQQHGGGLCKAVNTLHGQQLRELHAPPRSALPRGAPAQAASTEGPPRKLPSPSPSPHRAPALGHHPFLHRLPPLHPSSLLLEIITERWTVAWTSPAAAASTVPAAATAAARGRRPLSPRSPSASCSPTIPATHTQSALDAWSDRRSSSATECTAAAASPPPPRATGAGPADGFSGAADGSACPA